MKKTLAALALFTSVSSFAAGPADGIYSCAVNTLGTISQVYATVNGHPDGATIFVIAAVSPSTPFYGYGIGTATATSFSGLTMFGLPFSFVASPFYGSFTGTTASVIGNSVVNSFATCVRIW